MTESAGITDAVFRAVRNGNAFEETVERLLEGIKLGIYAAGDRLPAERELARLLGVSRITLRDALHELGTLGYVQTRRGRFGGTFVVRAPSPVPLASLSVTAAALEDALVYRSVVETGAAEMAARSTLSAAQREELTEGLALVQVAVHSAGPPLTPADPPGSSPDPPAGSPAGSAAGSGARRGAGTAGSSASSAGAGSAGTAGSSAGVGSAGPAGVGSTADYRAADTRLHLAIADATGSPLLVAGVLEARIRLVDLLNAIPMLPRNLEHANAQHATIVHAILAGDAAAAREAMAEHVAGTAALLRGFLRGDL